MSACAGPTGATVTSPLWHSSAIGHMLLAPPKCSPLCQSSKPTQKRTPETASAYFTNYFSRIYLSPLIHAFAGKSRVRLKLMKAESRLTPFMQDSRELPEPRFRGFLTTPALMLISDGVMLFLMREAGSRMALGYVRSSQSVRPT